MVWVWVWVCCLAPESKAQSHLALTPGSQVLTGLELGVRWGYILPHREELEAIVTGHAWGGEVTWGKHIEGGWVAQGKRKKAWQGLRLGYLNAGSEELGSVYSGIWLTRLPIWQSFDVEMGTGMAWATTPWHPADHPRSFALGSHWNVGLHLAIGWNQSLGKAGVLRAAFGFTHFSNGALLLPNLGINNVSGNLSWAPGSVDNETTSRQLASLSESVKRQGWKFETGLRLGMRDVGLPGGIRHPISTVQFTIFYRHRSAGHLSWSLSGDCTNNQSLRETNASAANQDQANRLQPSILGGIRWHFGQTALSMMQGWIIANPDRELGQRHLLVVLSHPFSPHSRVAFGLRSFRMRADFPFIGLTYAW